MMKKANRKPFRARSLVPVMIIAWLITLLSSGCDGLNINPQLMNPAPPAGEAPDGGPQGGTGEAKAWIEFPQEGQILPLSEIGLVAYAADSQNIAKIDLRMNGESLPMDAVIPLGEGGNSTLVRRNHSWLPDKEGEYILEARAQSGAGYGAPDIVKFCVVSCKPGQVMTTPTPAPNVTVTWTPTPTTFPLTITMTPSLTATTPPAAQQIQIEFQAVPPYVYGGSCAALSWSVQGAQAVYLDDVEVAAQGVKNVCPCERTTYTLTVRKPDGMTDDRQVTVDVYGSCGAPEYPTATEELPVIIITTQPPDIFILPTQEYLIPLETATFEAFPEY